MHIRSSNLRSQLVAFGVCEILLRLHYFEESDTVIVIDDSLQCTGNATYLYSGDNQIKIELVLWHTCYLSCYYSVTPSKSQDNTLN